jgi:predicted acetyltransferase
VTQIQLESATEADLATLGNLLQLYVHDLSALFDHVEIGEDGRFGYPELGSYVSGLSQRFAFLVRAEGRLAGFVLARRGSPASDDPNVLDIAEFFVLRKLRARGIGRAAAALLWDRLPGCWTIRAAERNASAVRFWRAAVQDYTGGRCSEGERLERSGKWIVQYFDNTARASEANRLEPSR